MAVVLKNKTIKHFDFNDVSSFEEVRTFDMTGGEDITALLPYMPRQHVPHPIAALANFVVKRSTVRKVPDPGGNGGEIVVHYEVPKLDNLGEKEDDEKPDLSKPPWEWPVQDYRVASVTVEQSLDKLYNYSKASGEEGYETPFESTSGTELSAAMIKPQAALSFGYNVQNFDETVIFQHIGKCNAVTMRIAGVIYPAACIQLQIVSASPLVLKNEDGSTKWRYYRIDVQFLIDPKSFWRQYQNRSTHAIFVGENGPSQIWTAEIEENDSTIRIYGSRKQIIEKVKDLPEPYRSSAQAVSETMYINVSNGEIADWEYDSLQLTRERQIPTYIEGIPYEPTDFSGLNLPMYKKIL